MLCRSTSATFIAAHQQTAAADLALIETTLVMDRPRDVVVRRVPDSVVVEVVEVDDGDGHVDDRGCVPLP